MVFSNPAFFAFLAFTLLVLAPPFSVTLKKKLLAALSCFFYAAWDWRYLGLLLFISAVDYLCAERMSKSLLRRRAWLLLSLVSNLALLGWFKYCNFFLDNLNGLLSLAGVRELPYLDILLPAGISFYTFKTMSYVIDVYRSELKPVRTLWDYVTFITFFPELIAGPIVRASVLLPQMDRQIGPSRDRLALGASIFLVGVTKKSLADHLGAMVEPVFASPAAFDSATLWAALFGYSLQIFCDFAGYSDMAIGVAKMIGYDLPENFKMPYLSRNITEFWRRWHITLSSWLRDYLYIPLGGNRLGTARTYGNLLITMLLGGLWHGASWNFVLWGALHGGALALHRGWTSFFGERMRLPPALSIPATVLFVSLAWIPFRCETFGATADMLGGLFQQTGVRWVAPELGVIVAILVVGHVLGSMLERRDTILGFAVRRDAVSGSYVQLGLSSGLSMFLVVAWVGIVFLTALTNTNPFIYFQF